MSSIDEKGPVRPIPAQYTRVVPIKVYLEWYKRNCAVGGPGNRLQFRKIRATRVNQYAASMRSRGVTPVNAVVVVCG